MLILFLKFIGYLNSEWSVVVIVVFFNYLREYTSDKKDKREKGGAINNGRPGGVWVIVWCYFALILFIVSVVNQDKYCFPAPEIAAILTFVIIEYKRTSD
ncbi:hypothetical protein COV49_00855 [Candidatus Falkowbacteria bacterium CG11_big_fil_rev_8_21_14_0_20_39_10]|uniref:Uncharacterized protein n=1 Tax=Candidatus Falkowbacteria bacterium CG11_big_fil_rev_8_21_14_0_20_39_10 TaxID=1974570 RepID=A0A2M6KA37_9BACT|nr:MAG: hypothetical protein COV49_00855 [Candidatus Falkowbacteria bacterium CG11_big_fil_rev_8_21_14_0_20_39_10]